MRTNIDLDNNLLTKAFKFTNLKTKKSLIHKALEEFVANHSRKDLREIKGKISFASGYNYKSMREKNHK